MGKKSVAAALALLPVLAFSAHGQADWAKKIQHFDDEPAIATAPDDAVDVDAEHDWRGWLERRFPDASAAWPKEAAAAFGEAARGVKWDFVGKGDFNRDGAPTGLLIKVERIPGSGAVVAKKLAVVKWRRGRWIERLRMDGGKGVRVNGVRWEVLSRPEFYGYNISFFVGRPGEASHPGAVINMNPVSREGAGLAENIGFCYSPRENKYASRDGDGDWSSE